MVVIRVAPGHFIYLYFFNHVERLVLKNDQLMSHYSLQDLPLLIERDTMLNEEYVQLQFATSRSVALGCTFKSLIYVISLAATLILKGETTRAHGGHLGFRGFRVKCAVRQLLQLESRGAMLTSKNVKIGPNLPVDLLPRDAIGFPHIGYELLQVPVFVNCMVRPKPALCIDHHSSLWTREYLPLIPCEQT